MDIEERLAKVHERLDSPKRLTQDELVEIGEELRRLEEEMRSKMH